MYQQVKFLGHKVSFEIDSGANNTLCGKETWIKIGKLKLPPVEAEYKFSDGKPLQVLRQFEVTVELNENSGGVCALFRLKKMISCGG